LLWHVVLLVKKLTILQIHVFELINNLGGKSFVYVVFLFEKRNFFDDGAVGLFNYHVAQVDRHLGHKLFRISERLLLGIAGNMAHYSIK
jgi:hypothetical protein